MQTFARSFARRIGLAGLAALVAVSPVSAEPDKTAAPEQCRGADMLAEMQASEPEIYHRVMDEANKLENTEALLWKVEKAGVGPNYLFGTIHMSDPRLTTLSEKVKAAIGGSKALALEVADLSDAAMAAAMGGAAELLTYTDGRNLESQLSPEEFKKVQELLMKSGMPAEFAGVFKPWLVSTLLAVSECERKQIAAGATVLDMKIAEEAQKHGLKVTGLETIQQQLSALASVPEDQQLQMLKVGLKYADRSPDLMETLVQMYLKHQIGAAMPFQIALALKHGTPASAFDGFSKALLVERNARMRDAAKPLLDAGDAFIAIGALHLPGETGLVRLLRDAGYTVTAVE